MKVGYEGMKITLICYPHDSLSDSFQLNCNDWVHIC